MSQTPTRSRNWAALAAASILLAGVVAVSAATFATAAFNAGGNETAGSAQARTALIQRAQHAMRPASRVRLLRWHAPAIPKPAPVAPRIVWISSTAVAAPAATPAPTQPATTSGGHGDSQESNDD